MKHFLIVILVAILAYTTYTIAGTALYADTQTTTNQSTAILRVSVVDGEGALLSPATVSVRSEEVDQAETQTSPESNGLYRFDLIESTYDVVATASNGRKASQLVTLRSDQPQKLVLVLK